jgi:Photosynthetic reaction centre cytochrome C subunit
MKKFKVLLVPGLLVMSLALRAQEPQGRGGQDAPGGAASARGGQSVPDVPGGQGAPGGARGGRGGAAGGAGGGGRGGGGGGPKNLQVLNQATLPETMQSFVLALGLLEKGTCAYCHVEDRSSDEKKPKVVARRMITMMRAINGTFPDGKQHVNCYTCHRGSTVPLTEPEP